MSKKLSKDVVYNFLEEFNINKFQILRINHFAPLDKQLSIYNMEGTIDDVVDYLLSIIGYQDAKYYFYKEGNHLTVEIYFNYRNESFIIKESLWNYAEKSLWNYTTKSIFYGRKQDLDRVEKQTLIAAI